MYLVCLAESSPYCVPDRSQSAAAATVLSDSGRLLDTVTERKVKPKLQIPQRRSALEAFRHFNRNESRPNSLESEANLGLVLI